MSRPGPSPTALIVGRGQASAQAALELARAGVGVTLVTADHWLAPGADGLAAVPALLEATTHAQISVLTGATVEGIQNDGPALRALVHQAPRYVNPSRCTACGACAEVCPVSLPYTNRSVHSVAPVRMNSADIQIAPGVLEGIGDRRHKAIYRGGVPTTYAIEKAGTAPCRDACPIDQRAQGYVALIQAGDFQGAYDCIKRDNPFPAICGRVCNHRCEDACSRGKADAPVNIMGLKRFVTDWVRKQKIDGDGPEGSDNGRELGVTRPQPTGKTVAIVGAGPAGLTCALELVRRGHAATVYEALPVSGGMMRVGVPSYRLPHDLVQREIEEIVAEGVNLVLSHRVEDVPGLLQEGFDAVFLAVGAHAGIRLPIPGADLPETLVATEFLRAISLVSSKSQDSQDAGEASDSAQPFDAAARIKGRRVLVLGGGNVAVDAAMSAVRFGASWVGLACLEGREQMPAHEWEIRDAEEEGIEVFPSRTFKEITADEGHVTGVRCARIDFRGFKDGRPDFDELPSTDEVIPVDVVIFAIGQRPEIDVLHDKVETIRGRFPSVDPETFETSLPGIFAGGDAVTGTAFIVDAIAAGRKAARSIDRFLGGRELSVEQARLPVVEIDEAEVQNRLITGQAASAERVDMKKRPPAERREDFDEIYLGLTEAEARAEATRCVSCGGCSECLQCEKSCPAAAISHQQQPKTWEFSTGAVIWNDLATSPSFRVAELPGVFTAQDGPSPMAAVDRALTHLGLTRPTPLVDVVAPSLWRLVRPATAARAPHTIHDPLHATARAGATQLFSRGATIRGTNGRDSRIGVFLCRCGGEIEQVVDLSAVAGRIKALPHVAFVGEIDFACHPEGSEAIRAMRAAHNLDGAVLAACSCCALDQWCYSCTTQRTRCKERLGVWDDGTGFPIQFVNVREQCAFVHRENAAAATLKAGDMVAASVSELSLTGGEGPFPISQSRLPITALIDPVRCRGCEDCEVGCGLEAIRVVGTNGVRIAQVDAGRCLGCGVCIAVCSSGAVLASDASDAQLDARLMAFGDLTDKTVVFSCNWGAYSAVEAAGVQGLYYDPSVRLVRLMCAGRAHDGLIMRAFVQGAARVLILTCRHEQAAFLSPRDASYCHYRTGSDQARRSVEQTRRLLQLLGIDPARLAIVEMPPGDGARFVAAMEEFVAATLANASEGRA